jgi:hypothetical protein
MVTRTEIRTKVNEVDCDALVLHEMLGEVEMDEYDEVLFDKLQELNDAITQWQEDKGYI